MAPYQLAKIVEWAKTLQTRKRLQKVIYLMQAAGCDFDADFILHNYGPYSHEVAALADQMTTRGLLEESAAQNMAGIQYSYRLTPKAREYLERLEATPEGRKLAAALSGFEQLADQLIDSPLSDLEYGATIVYFYKEAGDWDDAVEQACKFKRLQKESDSVRRALALAKSIVN